MVDVTLFFLETVERGEAAGGWFLVGEREAPVCGLHTMLCSGFSTASMHEWAKESDFSSEHIGS